MAIVKSYFEHGLKLEFSTVEPLLVVTTYTDEQKAVYNVAVESGFVGRYTLNSVQKKWLASFKREAKLHLSLYKKE